MSPDAAAQLVRTLSCVEAIIPGSGFGAGIADFCSVSLSEDGSGLRSPEADQSAAGPWKLNCWKGQTGQGAPRVHQPPPRAFAPSTWTIGHCQKEVDCLFPCLS